MLRQITISLLITVLGVLALTACSGLAPAPTNTPPPTATRTPQQATATSADENALPYQINLPPGFEISIYAQGVPNARSMALSPNGTLV